MNTELLAKDKNDLQWSTGKSAITLTYADLVQLLDLIQSGDVHRDNLDIFFEYSPNCSCGSLRDVLGIYFSIGYKALGLEQWNEFVKEKLNETERLT